MAHGIATRLGRLGGALLLAAAALPSWAQPEGGPTAAMDGAWHFTIVPYFWASGISGDVSVANVVRVPIDLRFSDVISDVDFGLQAYVEGRKDRIGFGLNVMYVDIGAPVTSDAPAIGRLGLEADVRQTCLEGFAFYRLASGGRRDNPAVLDVLAGARWADSRSRLTATTDAGIAYDGEFQDFGWVDALAGVKFRAPLGSRLALLGRADVAGLGSQVSWNLEGDLAFRASRHWAFGAGWRHWDIDYDDGKVFDIAYDGPRAWLSYTW
jgi:hypothetical protein